MIVSKLHGFIFVRGFKVAGTSVEAALMSICGESAVIDVREPHLSPREVRAARPAEWSKYRTIAIARNPWDFSVAAAHHKYRLELSGPYQSDHAREWMAANFARCIEEKYAARGEGHDLLNRDPKTPAERRAYEILGASVATGDWFWLDARGRPIEFDTVLRFESLEEDFQNLGLGVSLPRLNSFDYKASGAYREYYTDRTRQLVGELHAHEVGRFGYEF